MKYGKMNQERWEREWEEKHKEKQIGNLEHPKCVCDKCLGIKKGENMEKEMLVEGLQVLTDWLYNLDGWVSWDDCEQYLATHHEKEIALTHAMIVIIDVCRQFREGE